VFVNNVNMILAIDEKNGLWIKWKLAWQISKDMSFFKEITSKTNNSSKYNALIMWKKTWNSIPLKFKPLKNRINCILSRSSVKNNNNEFVIYSNSIDNLLYELNNKKNIENIFIIWWATIYKQFLLNNFLKRIYITRVFWDFWCDVFFDWIPSNFKRVDKTEIFEENWIKFCFEIYDKIEFE